MSRTTVARAGHGIIGFVSLAAVLLSLWQGWTTNTSLPEGVGYSGGFAAGWEHLLNRPAYFTFLSNFLVALTSLSLMVSPRIRNGIFHSLRICATVCIIITGVVFNILLRGDEPLTGIDWLTDFLGHVIAPVFAPVVWLLCGPRGVVTWKRIGGAALIPIAWLLITLGRGPAIDWYPYDILDVPGAGWGFVLQHVGAILMFFFIVALVMWVYDKTISAIMNRNTG